MTPGRTKGWYGPYSAVLGAVMAVLLVAPALARVLAEVPQQVSPSRVGAGIALVAFAYAGYLALARAFGPVATSAADAAWLLLSPLPRRRVLRKTILILAGISLAGGLVLALALLSAAGVRDQFMLRLPAAAVLGMSAAFGGMAAAVLAQASQTWDGWLVSAIIVVAVLAVLAVLASGSSLMVSAAGAPAGACGAAAVAAAGAAAARRSLAADPRHALRRRAHGADPVGADRSGPGLARLCALPAGVGARCGCARSLSGRAGSGRGGNRRVVRYRAAVSANASSCSR